ncbi:MAG: ATP-dependent zinc protease [Bdellovibrionales bacterium]|nr:ATP-dependent zinc protease [Bdellovibrionales bacterium]
MLKLPNLNTVRTFFPQQCWGLRLLLVATLLISGGFPNTGAADEELMTVKKPIKTSQPSTLGWVERIHVLPDDFELEAKLAPAISLSSIHAEDIKEFKRGDTHWVRFQIEDRNGTRHTLERELHGSKSLVTAEGTKSKKKVVRIEVCLGDRNFEVEALLSDRRELEQEVRLGRDALAGRVVVDPASTHTQSPHCKKRSPKSS